MLEVDVMDDLSDYWKGLLIGVWIGGVYVIAVVMITIVICTAATSPL